MQQVTWPPKQLPCELYDLIICQLPRESIQNMRLVNHEFEMKVSGYLFKRVVVPFKPELYSISGASPLPKGTSRNTAEPHGSVLLQDKGMRVFQGFGSHIRQFALSFEFDEALLSRPPVKTDQEAVTTFWGIYRWPFKEYNRYRQLEGLEQTADETRTMANALRFIINAKEIGLSIDGGLGWLAGPDTGAKPTSKPMVFGGPRVAPEQESNQQQKSLVTPNNYFSSDAWEYEADVEVQIGRNNRELLLERMLRESGYEGILLIRSLRTLAESEGPAPVHPLQTDSAEVNPARNEIIESTFRASSYNGPALVRTLPSQRKSNHGGRPEHRRSDDLEIDATEVGRTAMSMRCSSYYQDHNNVPLRPNDLSNAQKEMLLELEWAQRAFMQSWAIAIIDNVDTFQGIETLTIARLPSRHLPIIKRDDFWNGFASLKKISLAVIPDWREVVKLPTSFVQDVKVEPSRAVSTVFSLLKDHIAPRENIKSLHFEWICGGEDAAGVFARNKHILAAPFVHKAIDMVNMVQQPAILSLPHVEHLSLKNCWFSPDVLLSFADGHRHSLSSLILNSVSMCAPPPRHAVPGAAHNHPAHHVLHHHGPHHGLYHGAAFGGHVNVAMGVQNYQNGLGIPAHQHIFNGPPQAWNFPALVIGQGPIVVQHTAAPTPASPASWRVAPRTGSWAHIIDKLTPCETLDMLGYDPNRCCLERPVARQQKLRKLEFISCGYIHLPLDYNQSVLATPNGEYWDPIPIQRRRNELECYMMKSSDATMGTIINHISAFEALQLEHAFHMQLGWQADDARLREEQAEADGITSPGKGRFRGIVEREDSGHA